MDNNTKTHEKVCVNFVSDDQLLIERISYYFRKREDIHFEYSNTPLVEENIEIYIVPIICDCEKIATLYPLGNLRNPLGNRRSPVIFYGNSSFLRKAILAGCVDYLKDPWTVDELEFRLEKLIKEIKKIFIFSWGSITFIGTDIVSENRRCALLYQEYRILKILLQQRGNAVPRDVLFYSLWNRPGTRQSRVIDMHISSIRKKLRVILPDDYCDEVIISVRGIGYMIR
jgi:DNA-binding winged helix-turn-helix (wHTH) protein